MIIFFRVKNSQRWYFAWENLRGGFCCIFILLLMFFILFLIFILLSFVDFLHSHFAFRHHPSPFRGLSPGFYTHFILSAQPIAEWFATLSISTILLSSYRKRYGFEWTFFIHRHFLPYAPSPTFMTQLAFIKASLGAGSFSLKFAGFHTDPRNRPDSSVWFTVVHNSFVLVGSL